MRHASIDRLPIESDQEYAFSHGSLLVRNEGGSTLIRGKRYTDLGPAEDREEAIRSARAWEEAR